MYDVWVHTSRISHVHLSINPTTSSVVTDSRSSDDTSVISSGWDSTKQTIRDLVAEYSTAQTAKGCLEHK
jgi:hypothetical protein